MVRIDKPYVFTGPSGPRSLLDLFEGRSQLVIYHFMFQPEWDAGCPNCTGFVDEIGNLSALHGLNTTFALVSRAPYEKLAAYRAARGWDYPWYSSSETDFNYDFHVTLDESVLPFEYNYRSKAEWDSLPNNGHTQQEQPFDLHGLSCFLRDGDDVHHTYSTYGRGPDAMTFTVTALDLTALGRQEPWEKPEGRTPARMPKTTATERNGPVCKPDSVVGDHPSTVTVAGHLQQPTRELGRAALERSRERWSPTVLLGLAPRGVYRASAVTCGAGGLLHHRFTLTRTPTNQKVHRSRWRSVLCGTVPRVTPGGRYPPRCPVESGLSSAPWIPRTTRSPDRPVPSLRIRPPVPPLATGRRGPGCTDGPRQPRPGSAGRRCAGSSCRSRPGPRRTGPRPGGWCRSPAGIVAPVRRRTRNSPPSRPAPGGMRG